METFLGMNERSFVKKKKLFGKCHIFSPFYLREEKKRKKITFFKKFLLFLFKFLLFLN